MYTSESVEDQKESEVNAMFRATTCAVAAVLFLLPAEGLSQTGKIAGAVSVAGPVPAPRSIEVTKNKEFCGNSILARDLVVKDKKLAFAVAFVEGLAGEVQPGEYLLSNSACSFNPPVLATSAGGILIVENRDDILHNTHLNLERGSRSRTVGNWALSGKGVTIRAERPLRQPGTVDVECDAHSWMHAKIRIFDHRYYAVTDEAGTFEIAGIPQGTYTLKVWHEVLGELEQEVTVRPDATTSVAFVFSVEKLTTGKKVNR